jgi:hypothetical protein
MANARLLVVEVMKGVAGSWSLVAEAVDRVTAFPMKFLGKDCGLSFCGSDT